MMSQSVRYKKFMSDEATSIGKGPSLYQARSAALRQENELLRQYTEAIEKGNLDPDIASSDEETLVPSKNARHRAPARFTKKNPAQLDLVTSKANGATENTISTDTEESPLTDSEEISPFQVDWDNAVTSTPTLSRTKNGKDRASKPVNHQPSKKTPQKPKHHTQPKTSTPKQTSEKMSQKKRGQARENTPTFERRRAVAQRKAARKFLKSIARNPEAVGTSEDEFEALHDVEEVTISDAVDREMQVTNPTIVLMKTKHKVCTGCGENYTDEERNHPRNLVIRKLSHRR